jgi:DNA-binding PadR family transcriptional regulator
VDCPGTAPARLPDRTGDALPLLRGLEKEGYLRSQETRQGRLRFVHYAATAKGRRDLKKVREKLRELFRELVEEGKHAPEPKPADDRSSGS